MVCAQNIYGTDITMPYSCRDCHVSWLSTITHAVHAHQGLISNLFLVFQGGLTAADWAKRRGHLQIHQMIAFKQKWHLIMCEVIYEVKYHYILLVCTNCIRQPYGPMALWPYTHTSVYDTHSHVHVHMHGSPHQGTYLCWQSCDEWHANLHSSLETLCLWIWIRPSLVVKFLLKAWSENSGQNSAG